MSTQAKKDPRIEQYLKECAPFAKAILNHFRKIVRKACPEAQETLKWSMPFFTYEGKILCGMAGFKAHCRVGVWSSKKYGFDQLGHILKRSELPSDKELITEIRTEMERISKSKTKSAPKGIKGTAKKTVSKMPADFKKSLSAKPKALANFEAFSPSKRKDYITWITDAKTETTRTSRLKNAILWISQGKARNWKYEKKK